MKKMMRRLLFLCVGISLFSCLKPDEPTHYEIPQDFIDYNIFPKGSYWIYQDSLTKEIDSVYVTDTSVSEDSYDKHSKSTYDSYRIKIIIHNDNVSFHPFLSSKEYLYFLFPSNYQIHKNQVLEYKKLNNVWVPNGEMLDKFTVQGVEYSNVCKQIHQEEGSGKNQYSYFVKGIGCIKKSYSRWIENEDGKTSTLRDEVWELIRYKISDEPIRVISKEVVQSTSQN